MNALILVPTLICLFLVLRGRTTAALLAVYLPVAFLAPESYAIRLPHAPELSMSELAVIPLGVVAVYRLLQKGQPILMDFLVALFVISAGISEILNEHVTKDGIFIAGISLISMFLPYAIGRTMIEPSLRLATVQRIVLIVLFLGIAGVYEWRMGRNLYSPMGRAFGVDMSPNIQLRGGHGRFSASFSDAEIAGIAVAMAATLNAWLAYLRRINSWEKSGRLLSLLEKYHVAGMVLLVYIYLTQSRGPELALVVGYLILQIPRFKNIQLAAGVVAVLIFVGAIGGYQAFMHYTDVPDINAVNDEQQGSALYRRRMVELYQPILDQGGWLGWGYKSIPHAPGLSNLGNGVQSIDNEFLYVDLGQGRFGFIIFVLIAVDSIRGPIIRARTFTAPQDLAFACSMVASLAVLWIALATVYMGDQLPQIAFLFIGWAQSIEPGTRSPASIPERFSNAKFIFRRVLS